MASQGLHWTPPQVGEDTPASSSGHGGDDPKKPKKDPFRNGFPKSACDQCRDNHRGCKLNGPRSQGCEECRRMERHCSYMDGQEGTARPLAGASAPVAPDPAISSQAPPEQAAQDGALNGSQQALTPTIPQPALTPTTHQPTLAPTTPQPALTPTIHQQALTPTTHQPYHHQQWQQYPDPAHLADGGLGQNQFVAVTNPPLHREGLTGVEHHEHDPYALHNTPHTQHNNDPHALHNIPHAQSNMLYAQQHNDPRALHNDPRGLHNTLHAQRNNDPRAQSNTPHAERNHPYSLYNNPYAPYTLPQQFGDDGVNVGDMPGPSQPAQPEEDNSNDYGWLD